MDFKDIPETVRRMLGIHESILDGTRAFTSRQAKAIEVREGAIYLEGAFLSSDVRRSMRRTTLKCGRFRRRSFATLSRTSKAT